MYPLIQLNFIYLIKHTLVRPSKETVVLYDVVAWAVPNAPDITLKIPSTAMPRFIACRGTGYAWQTRDVAM
jgi:hypothetical protein